MLFSQNFPFAYLTALVTETLSAFATHKFVLPVKDYILTGKLFVFGYNNNWLTIRYSGNVTATLTSERQLYGEIVPDKDVRLWITLADYMYVQFTALAPTNVTLKISTECKFFN